MFRALVFNGFLLVMGLGFGLSDSSFAADPTEHGSDADPAMTPMAPELKRDMADMYSEMAECMKTDKSMEQCQKEIMEHCAVMKKTKHCPLLEGMKPMMKMNMKGGNMQNMQMEH